MQCIERCMTLMETKIKGTAPLSTALTSLCYKKAQLGTGGVKGKTAVMQDETDLVHASEQSDMAWSRLGGHPSVRDAPGGLPVENERAQVRRGCSVAFGNYVD